MSRKDSDFTYNSQHTPIASLNHGTGAPSIPQAPVWVTLPPKRLRRGWLVTLLVLIMIAVIGAGLGAFFWVTTRPHSVISQKNQTAGGQAFFTSSTYFDTATGLPSIDDKLQLELQNIAPPTAGKSYYGWLLNDKKQSSSTPIALGVLPVDHGTIRASYVDPRHTDLLGNFSRILITEEDTALSPGSPSTDISKWKYSAELPQAPDPNDMQHLSMLDHLRLLLVQDPALMPERPGGLDIWLLKNTGRVAEWAYSARGFWPDVASMRPHFIRILDYLDGDAYVQADVPGTPVAPSPIGLLGANMTNVQHPPTSDYLDLISDHLGAIARAPGVAPEKRQAVARIIASINTMRIHLESVRQYAKQLHSMDETQLRSQDASRLLNNMMAEAFYAYVGQLDPSTAELQSGALQIQQNIERLATFDITPYNP